MNEIGIFNEYKEFEEFNELKPLTEYAVKYLKLDNVMFNVIIVNNEKIHEINKNYRNIDRETDVISFALEDDSIMPETDIRVLGDIYISLDKVISQAKEYNHSLKREVCFLCIHGLLHLLGYDHMNEKDEKIMFSLQEEILDSYGIKRE